jgi:hypothetical protein
MAVKAAACGARLALGSQTPSVKFGKEKMQPITPLRGRAAVDEY